MRCYCCDKVLTDYEATLRSAESDDFLETCTKCLEGLSIATKGRNDLLPKHMANEYNEDEDADWLLDVPQDFNDDSDVAPWDE